jgi:hypothetical protein
LCVGAQLANAQTGDLNKDFADPVTVLRDAYARVSPKFECKGAKRYIKETLDYVETIARTSPQQLYAVRRQAWAAVEGAKDGVCLPRDYMSPR